MGGRVGLGLAVAGGLLAVALVARSSSAERANLNFTLPDMHGEQVTLSAFAGKPILINLWATWCGPCRLEMPQLIGLGNKFRDRGFTVIGVSVDDTPDAIRAFAAEFSVNYPMLVGLGQDELLRSLGYEGVLPMSVLIAADGTVAARVRGIETTESWERRILSLF